MYASFIRSVILLLLFTTIAFTQNEKKTVADTLVYKQKYGLRLGADISKLARSFLDDNYTGFEVMVSPNVFILLEKLVMKNVQSKTKF